MIFSTNNAGCLRITIHAIQRYQERFAHTQISKKDADLHLRIHLRAALPWGGQKGRSIYYIATCCGEYIYFIIDMDKNDQFFMRTCLTHDQAQANIATLIKNTQGRKENSKKHTHSKEIYGVDAVVSDSHGKAHRKNRVRNRRHARRSQRMNDNYSEE